MDGKVDMATTIAEESSGDLATEGGSDREVGVPEPFAGGNEGGEGEEIEEGAKEGGDLVMGFGEVVE